MLDLEPIKARLDATPPQIGHFTWQQGSDTIYGLATGAPAEWFYGAAQSDMRALIAEIERIRMLMAEVGRMTAVAVTMILDADNKEATSDSE